jgi:hypothetical protein
VLVLTTRPRRTMQGSGDGGVDGDGAVGKIGVGVSTVEEERSQGKTSRSEPRRQEWCAQGAMSALFDGKVSTMRQGLGH